MPCGSTRSSAVCTWVWVPTTAVAWPSRYQPIAIFSEVTSAWKSTKTICAPSAFSRATSRAAVVNGSSMLARKTRPITLTTPTRTPLAAVARIAPAPGVPAG